MARLFEQPNCKLLVHDIVFGKQEVARASPRSSLNENFRPAQRLPGGQSVVRVLRDTAPEPTVTWLLSANGPWIISSVKP